MAQPIACVGGDPEDMARQRDELAKSVAAYAAAHAPSEPDQEQLTRLACQAIDCDDLESLERIIRLGLSSRADVGPKPDSPIEERQMLITRAALRLRGRLARALLEHALETDDREASAVAAVELSPYVGLRLLQPLFQLPGWDAHMPIFSLRGGYRTLLTYACGLPEVPCEAISLLLAHGANARGFKLFHGDDSDTPLEAATRAGRCDVIRVLGAAGAATQDSDTAPSVWYAAVYEAIRRGNERCVQELLALDTDRSLMRKSGSLLHTLTSRNDLHLMQLFYDHGACLKPNVMSYLRKRTSAATLKWLLENGCGVQEPALHKAARIGVEHVRLMLQWNADPDGRDADRCTPLHLVRHEESAELLLLAGASVFARNRRRRTPFHVAAEREDVGMMRLLLRWGAMAYERPEKLWNFFKYMRNNRPFAWTIISDAMKQRIP